MKCKDVQLLLPDLLTGDLDHKKDAAVQNHLLECQACRAEVENLRKLWSELGSLPAEKPGPNMRPRFDAMLATYKQGMQHATPKITIRERLNIWLEKWWPRQPLIQFASAAAFLIVGLLIGFQFRSSEPGGSRIHSLQNELEKMRQLTAISLMSQDSPSERLHGISIGAKVEQPGDKVLQSLLQTLNNDPNVNVRLAAVDALYLFRNKTQVRQGLIESLSRQTSPLVQIALIDLLTEIREEKSIEALRQLIQENNLNLNVKERAETGLRQLL